ncbi:MAG TPA: hypothetical protein VMV34_02295 [Terriglobia bacterium]|nr:hypothetical protein [Terriglobia bacterium]
MALIIYTALMLGLHLTSWKLVAEWQGAEDTWVKRWLPAMWVVRVEAFYWLLALAAWPLWSSLMEVLVAAFATIHLVLWIGMEWKRSHDRSLPGDGFFSHKLTLVVTTFDFVEAFALIVLGYSAMTFVLHT